MPITLKLVFFLASFREEKKYNWYDDYRLLPSQQLTKSIKFH
jgi:hypothetical protein